MNAVRKDEKTSSLAQHVRTTSHRIDFDNTRMVANIEHYTSRITREAIEIEKRPQNLNKRDDTQRLPISWKPALSGRYILENRRPLGAIPQQRPTNDENAQQPTSAGPITRSRRRMLAIQEDTRQPTATSRHEDARQPATTTRPLVGLAQAPATPPTHRNGPVTRSQTRMRALNRSVYKEQHNTESVSSVRATRSSSKRLSART